MRITVQLSLIGTLLLVGCLAWAASGIALKSGGRLTVRDTVYNRALPHSFYDQAMSSLPHLYPKYQVLASRRAGVLGEVVYALVCYKENPSTDRAVIQAVAVFEDRAWNLEATSPLSYGDTLLEVLEHIGKLASDAGIQRAPASGRR